MLGRCWRPCSIMNRLLPAHLNTALLWPKNYVKRTATPLLVMHFQSSNCFLRFTLGTLAFAKFCRVKYMIKRRLVGLTICSAFVARSYGHDPTASPTPTPAVYQNATAATYSGSVPNTGLQAPAGNPSPSKGTLLKMSSHTVSPSSSTPLVKPTPSPKLAKIAASYSPDLLNAAPTPAPKFVKAIASLSPNASEIVGPPAPNLVKAVASGQPRPQKQKADAALPPTVLTAASSPQPKLLKAMESTSAEFVRPIPNPPATKPPSAAATPPSAVSPPSLTAEPEVKLI